MKRRLVALVVILFLGASAFALTDGSITISGIVPQSVYLSISSNQINLKADQDSESPFAVTT
jgi:type 1 fimbria pilin